MPRGLLIVNPASGKGRARAAVPAVLELARTLGLELSVFETSARGSAEAAARAMDAACDRALVTGGDGTVSEVISGLAERRAAGLPPAAVGLIPAGTSNSAARELGIPLDFEGAVRVAATGRPRALDLGFFRSIGESSAELVAAPAAPQGRPGLPPGTRLFFLCASAGPDAEIVRTLHRERRGPTSRLAYVLHGARCFFAYSFGRIRVASDGRELAGGVSMAVASNMSQYGGPLRITPEARADDGELDLCALRPRSRLSYIGLVRAAFRGGVTGRHDAETVRARSVRLHPEDPRRPVPFQADGEPAGYLPVELGILPAAQEFLVSAG